MKQEIDIAAAYWSDLLAPHLSYNCKQSFHIHLSQLLAQKYSSHWYIDTPQRGQAYREIVCDPENTYIDVVLTRAAEESGFNFIQAYGPNRGLRMWVDPGEVEISFTESPLCQRIIYQQQSRSLSPVQQEQSFSDESVYYPSHSYMDYNLGENMNMYSYAPSPDVHQMCNFHYDEAVQYPIAVTY
mmetsp:Transcript_132303/g.197116  ORF Transcript_132303/g.197116 Transcript_132303/m.197116 type:complete len:185 (-) Transcript_132303:105-659(-)